MEIESANRFVVPVPCRNCGRPFDLNLDIHGNQTIEEVLRENCGASELLCWECRDCKEEIE